MGQSPYCELADSFLKEEEMEIVNIFAVYSGVSKLAYTGTLENACFRQNMTESALRRAIQNRTQLRQTTLAERDFFRGLAYPSWPAAESYYAVWA